MLHSISLFEFCILTHLSRKKTDFFLFSVFAHHIIPWRFCSLIFQLFYLRSTKLLSTLKAHSKVFHWNNLNLYLNESANTSKLNPQVPSP